jgi:hypothetical protein
MDLTARQLNRATLDRQMLLERRSLGAVEAIGHLAALQAQEAASPYLALWNRLAGFDPGDLDAAFAHRTVVRAPLIRLTLHAVRGQDWPAFHNAMVRSLRASRLADRRFLTSGLSAGEVDALLPHLTAFLTRPRTEDEIEEMIERQLGGRHPRAWWALRRYAPLHRAPTGGPWSFAGSAFVGATTALEPDAEDASTRELVRRYLGAFGPASAQDVAQFTMLRRPVVSRALAAPDGDVVRVAGPGGAKLYDLAGAGVPNGATHAPPRLLPMWDSTLLAYADRGRVVPAEYRSLVIRRNGDVLPTLLVDGYVAGVWRPAEGGIEATAFKPLDDETWKGLAAEASDLVAFLADRDPAVYGRYAHWWGRDLPTGEVRMLPD